MIQVFLKVNKTLTGEYWKNQAIGSLDQYGNPFRIIKLLWTGGQLHPNTDYSKTRGFENTIISKNNKTGGFSIRYNKEGNVTWQRPVGNIGPFFGELADTPYNREKLASCYGDKMWSIADADMDRIIRAMYEKRVKGMDRKTVEFNQLRVASMMTSKSSNVKLEPNVPLEAEKMILNEDKRNVEVRKQELDKREAELEKKNAAIVDKQVKAISSGDSLINYSEEYLNKLNFPGLKAVAKELKLKYPLTVKMAELKKALMEHQTGKEVSFNKEEEVPAKAVGTFDIPPPQSVQLPDNLSADGFGTGDRLDE